MATGEHVETLIIGGGQAGLAVGYHLKSKKRDFLILDANERVGDSWRKRWPSLRLYSPAKLDGLAGHGVSRPRLTPIRPAPRWPTISSRTHSGSSCLSDPGSRWMRSRGTEADSS